MADDPTFDEASLRRSLGAIARDGLIPMAAALTVLFAVLAVTILLAHPSENGAAVAALFGLSALGSLIALRRFRSCLPPLDRVNAILLGVFTLALFDGAVVQIALAPAMRSTFPLLIVVAGFLLLNAWWLLAAIAVASGVWVVSILVAPTAPPALAVMSEWSAAVVLAATIHLVHVRTLRRLERLRQVDERRQRALTAAVERAQESEDRFRTFSSATIEGIVVHDQGLVLDANQALLDMLGVTLEEAVNRSAFEFFAPESRDKVRDMVARRDEARYEAICLRPDGSTFPAEVCGRAGSYQGRTVRVAALRDVTRRKENEAALRASEARYRQMFEDNRAIKLLIDPETGQIVDANTAAAHYYGYDRDALLKMCIFDLNVLSSEHVREMMRLAAHTTQTLFQFQHRLASGESRHVEVFSGPLDLGDRTVLYSIIMDINDRKRAEAEREQLIQELDAFSHTVAHDLKNPLNIVMAYARLLEEDFAHAIPVQQRHYLREITGGASRMQSIVDELLLLAQMRQSDVILEPLDMLLVVADVCSRMQPILNEYRAELIVGENWPPALGYAPWIAEVWINYMSNALKYGGSPPVVELGATPLAGGDVRFWVRDNGSGLTPDEQVQLFTPFNRLERLNTKGYGLGLSIVQRIVDKLGGKVGVESAPGQGSRFYFELGAVPPDAVPASDSPPPSR